MFTRAVSTGILLPFLVLLIGCSENGFKSNKVNGATEQQSLSDNEPTSGEVTRQTVALSDSFQEFNFVQKNGFGPPSIAPKIDIVKINAGNIDVTYTFGRNNLTQEHYQSFTTDELTCVVTVRENIRFMRQIFEGFVGITGYVYDNCSRVVDSTGILRTVCTAVADAGAHYIQIRNQNELDTEKEGLVFHLFEASTFAGPGNVVLNDPEPLRNIFNQLINNARAAATDCEAPAL